MSEVEELSCHVCMCVCDNFSEFTVHYSKKNIYKVSICLQIFRSRSILAGWQNMCGGQKETVEIFFWNGLYFIVVKVILLLYAQWMKLLNHLMNTNLMLKYLKISPVLATI